MNFDNESEYVPLNNRTIPKYVPSANVQGSFSANSTVENKREIIFIYCMMLYNYLGSYAIAIIAYLFKGLIIAAMTIGPGAVSGVAFSGFVIYSILPIIGLLCMILPLFLSLYSRKTSRSAYARSHYDFIIHSYKVFMYFMASIIVLTVIVATSVHYDSTWLWVITAVLGGGYVLALLATTFIYTLKTIGGLSSAKNGEHYN